MRDIFTYVNDNGDSLVLSAVNGYRVTSITGTSGISVNANQAQGIGQIGTTVQSRVVQSVPMTITGYLFGTRAQIEASAERLFLSTSVQITMEGASDAFASISSILASPSTYR